MKSDNATKDYIKYMNDQGVKCIDYVADSPRRSWGGWKKRDVSKIIGMCWHQALGWTNLEQTIKYQIGKNSHFKTKPPAGCYTGFVSKDGTYYVINNLQDRTWSQGTTKTPGDENALYFAVCFEGAFTYPNMDAWSQKVCKEPSLEQIVTSHNVWSKSQDYFNWEPGQLFGHYHFGKAACPGSQLQAIIENYRADKTMVPTKELFKIHELVDIQTALQSLGYNPGPPDNIMGIKTKTAILEFQKDCALTVDGIAGPNTRKRLEMIYNKGDC